MGPANAAGQIAGWKHRPKYGSFRVRRRARIILRDARAFRVGQGRCDTTHLFIDVVVAGALRERGRLSFEVAAVLRGQRWRASFVAARSMTTPAGADAPRRIAPKN